MRHTAEHRSNTFFFPKKVCTPAAMPCAQRRGNVLLTEKPDTKKDIRYDAGAVHKRSHSALPTAKVYKMDKMIFFKNNNLKTDYCRGQVYYDFLDYAFSRADYFMLVYVNYYGKGYTAAQKHFKNVLNAFKVKSRTNPSWAGTPRTYCPNSTYKIVFYCTNSAAKEILKEVDHLSAWSRPSYPEDLSFFIGNQCWAYSVGHENIQGIIHANKQDIEFAVSHGLADYSDAEPYNSYYDLYDEVLVKNKSDEF